ncbi:MAG: VOC family protein [Acidobacteria bacterium]|nr:VOC family protein [Acidobacteriota bacterium]
MKITGLRPTLWTEDFNATVAFYTEVLDFRVEDRNDDWGWASLNKDDVWIMLAKPNEHEKFDKIGFTGSFYFTVEDAEATWQELKDKARVCYDIETFPWGMREFAIYDTNGYILQFAQQVHE